MTSNRTFQELIRRYITFVIALFVMAFGRALSIHANLGSSPSTCPPYVLSLIPGSVLTIGVYTMIMHIVFTLIQAFLLKSDFQKIQFLQVFVGILFGEFMDVAMWITTPFQSDILFVRYLILLLGCVFIAVGIVIEVKCDVLILAVEGLAAAISKKTKSDFGKIKILTDVGFVVLSVVIMFIAFGHWDWKIVGIGTLIAMFLVGFLVRLFNPYFSWLKKIFKGKDYKKYSVQDDEDKPLVITISRGYGAGGRVIGEKLSKYLGINLYDNEITEEVVSVLGYDKETVLKKEQNISTFDFIRRLFTDKSLPKSMSLNEDDEIYHAQKRTIRNIADKESCIILGRCSNYVLRKRENCIRIFVYSSPERAAKRIAAATGENIALLPQKIQRINRARANHYRHYTHHQWDDTSQYDLMINTTNISTDQAVKMILEFLENSSQVSIK